MQEIKLSHFRHGMFHSDLAEVVQLYNAALTNVHGFYPITEKLFLERIVRDRNFIPSLFMLAKVDGVLAGMIHAGILHEPYYEDGATLEMVAVHPEYRRRGIGKMLLEAMLRKLALFKVVDGGGAYPFSIFYATMLDGSERSGIAFDNIPALRLFCHNGFELARKSLIMNADLSRELPPLPEPLAERKQKARIFFERRNPGETWLDHVFRGWELFDSRLAPHGGGEIFSRAIYARMPERSQLEGREVYAVFGVHTPDNLRGQGWASIHFRLLREHLRTLGAQVLELHVYEDNTPAVKLYERSGFAFVKHTAMLRRKR